MYVIKVLLIVVVDPLARRTKLSPDPRAIGTTVPSGLASTNVLFGVSVKPVTPGELWMVIAPTIAFAASTASEKVDQNEPS